MTRILVPLDGSERSHEAVARARNLLDLPEIAVTLLHVIECKEDRANDLGYQMDSRHHAAYDALAQVRAGIADRSAASSADVRFGDPATEILREIAEGNHDLVLLCTFGRPGLGRSLLGKVAQRVLHSSPAPLLLFRPRMRSDPTPSLTAKFEETRFKNLLVALDGSKEAEEILPAAENMARTLGSTLHLFRAVSGGSKGVSERLGAEEYLRTWERRLESQGIPSEVHVRTGGAADGAISLVHELGIDSAALSTHARRGLARSVCGSVTEEILRGVELPVLTLCPLGCRGPMPASALEHRHVSVG